MESRRPETAPPCAVVYSYAAVSLFTRDDIPWSTGDEGDPRYDLALALLTEPEIQLSDVELTAFFEGYRMPPLDRRTRRWFEDLYEFF